MIADIEQKDILWIIIAVFVLLTGAGIVMLLIRRKFRSESSTTENPEVPFTLDQVRQMHQQGHISEGEFQRLKDKILKETLFDRPDK
ncbi:MAG: hypothetical protein AMJ79_04815 [Phycisphaerae bacterium SM23_30]|nr:MAG: hypothetical protein AMJ79_04815 [Phycisphaerae bacterium SM23_30]